MADTDLIDVPTKLTHGIVMLCRADHVINQEQEDVVQRVLEITGGEGAYAALDPIAGDFTGTVGRATSCALIA